MDEPELSNEAETHIHLPLFAARTQRGITAYRRPANNCGTGQATGSVTEAAAPDGQLSADGYSVDNHAYGHREASAG